MRFIGARSVSSKGKPSDMPDKPSLEALFENEECGLVRFACSFVKRRDIAEELVQEAFLRVHRHWDDVENPRAWIYRATRNLALSHIRDNAREVEMTDDTNAGTDTDRKPDEALRYSEALGTMRMLLAELPEEEQILVKLKFVEELSYAGISENTGLSVSNVGYKLHQLLKNLASSMRQAGIENSHG